MRLHELASPAVLACCFEDIRRRTQAPGADGVTPAMFAQSLEKRLEALSTALRGGTWRPSALVRVHRAKPGGGTRRLAIPVVGDRVVIEMLRRGLSPEIEPLLSEAAYAYRPGKSAHAAVDAVQKRIEGGAGWVALGDIRDFFDTVPLATLVDALREIQVDKAIVRITELLLHRHAMRPGHGLAQGSSLSPLLSNFALTPFDRRLLAAGFTLIRYCDNLCIPAATEAIAHEALATMRREAQRVGLALKPAESQIAEVRTGFLWLGFWLGPHGRQVSDGAVQALRARLDAGGRGVAGEALRQRVQSILRGWIQYFNAPFPQTGSLGEHDALARTVLAELRPTQIKPGQETGPAFHENDAPGTLSPDDGVDADWESWDDLHPLVLVETDDTVDADRESLLRQADHLAASGAYEEAELAFESAQRLVQRIVSKTETHCDPTPEHDEESIDAFLGLFCAGQDTFEAAPRGSAGRRDFTGIARPPTPADVREHLAGRTSIAVRPRLADGTCTIGVLDIDGLSPDASVAVQAYVQALLSVARAWSWQVLVEETGGRGVHLWFPVGARIAANDMARSLAALKLAAGAASSEARIEHLPGEDAAPDLHAQTITLPLGVHVETGARSRLRWAHGTHVETDLSGLFAGSANDPTLFVRSPVPASGGDTDQIEPSRTLPQWSSFGRNVARIMDGCAVLRHLAEKAVMAGHLNHGERLSLLYTLGHLGPSGEQAIHSIIGACQNYSVAETTRQIGRLTGLPIGCARMRDKHATQELLPLCCCDFGDVRRRGGYPTPLLHATGFRKSWREILYHRRDAEMEAGKERERDPADRGVVAVRENAGDAGASDLEKASTRGVLVHGAPPHEWA